MQWRGMAKDNDRICQLDIGSGDLDLNKARKWSVPTMIANKGLGQAEYGGQDKGEGLDYAHHAMQ